MIILTFLALLVTLLPASQPYILITANVDDVEALAQQLYRSPVAEDLQRIWRRAAMQFQREMRKPARQRGRYRSMEYNSRRSNIDDALVEWGKNASIYLKTLRRVLDNI